jgi:hypothetical protein
MVLSCFWILFSELVVAQLYSGNRPAKTNDSSVFVPKLFYRITEERSTNTHKRSTRIETKEKSNCSKDWRSSSHQATRFILYMFHQSVSGRTIPGRRSEKTKAISRKTSGGDEELGCLVLRSTQCLARFVGEGLARLTTDVIHEATKMTSRRKHAAFCTPSRLPRRLIQQLWEF